MGIKDYSVMAVKTVCKDNKWRVLHAVDGGETVGMTYSQKQYEIFVHSLIEARQKERE